MNCRKQVHLVIDVALAWNYLIRISNVIEENCGGSSSVAVYCSAITLEIDKQREQIIEILFKQRNNK